MNREIERKFIFRANTFDNLRTLLIERYGDPERGSGRDYFYKSHGIAEFLRLREMPNGRGELTSKVLDTESVQDREELNVGVVDFAETHRILKRTQEYKGCLIKNYCNWFLDGGTALTLYVVHCDSQHVFFEIEAETEGEVDALHQSLVFCFPDRLQIAGESLFKMYLGGGRRPHV